MAVNQKSFLDKFNEGTLTEADFKALQTAIIDSLEHEIDQSTHDKMEQLREALLSPQDSDFNPFEDPQYSEFSDVLSQLDHTEEVHGLRGLDL